MVIAFNKPYGVLSRFTPEPGSRWRTLAEFGLPKGVYSIGRLDADSEGLLLLSDERELNSALLDARQEHPREYWAQVEGQVGESALQELATGVTIGGYRTRPARAWRIEPAPVIAARIPPIRFRKSIPATWIGLELIEGKNRQVRRMTAAVGHPTLRLLRVRVGPIDLAELNLAPGQWRRQGQPR